MCKLGLSSHPNRLALKLRELGKGHDEELLLWKKEVEISDEVKRASETLQKELSDLSYLPQLPSVEDFRRYACRFKGVGEQTAQDMQASAPDNLPAVSSFATLDATCLSLACTSDPHTVTRNICDKLLGTGISRDGLVRCVEELIEPSSQSGRATGYQIVGDNCDLHVNVRHMTKDNRNKSFHWFNRVAFKDQASGSDLPDLHTTTLAAVPVASFFPSHEEIQELKGDFMTLWSRVLVKHLEPFGCFKHAVVYNIPHQYSEIMKNPVPEVGLKLL